MPEPPTAEPELLHRFKNHLAIIVGFCELLLAELPEDDTKRPDILEIYQAAQAAMALMPDLARHLP